MNDGREEEEKRREEKKLHTLLTSHDIYVGVKSRLER